MSDRETKRRIILLVVGLAAGLAAGEVVARLGRIDAQPPVVPPIYRASEIIPWDLLPDAVGEATRPDEPGFRSDIVINELGYRQRSFNPRKPDATKRLLVVGDSFVFGLGVQERETLPRVLERLLNDGGEGATEVINGGFAGGDAPDTYYLYLKSRGLELQPDGILIAVLPRNDFSNLMDHDWDLSGDGTPSRVRSRTEYIDAEHRRRRREPGGLSAELRRYSALWSLAADARHRWRTGGVNQGAITYLRDEMPEAWRRMEIVLRAIRDLADERDIPVALILIPGPLQVHPEAWSAEGVPFEESLFEGVQPQERLRSIAADLELPVVDLLEPMRQAGRSTRLYFLRDGHWNVAGHALAARLVEGFLLTEPWWLGGPQ